MTETVFSGIHIGTATTRTAELRRTGSTLEITHLECKPLEELKAAASPVTAYETRSLDALPGNSTVHVASLPSPLVMSRCWSLPSTEEAKLRQMVAHRLEADLPIPIEQITWEYRKTGRLPSEADGVRILAQAVKTDQLDEHMHSLTAKGIRVNIMTTEAEALNGLYQHGLRRTSGSASKVLVLATSDDWIVAAFAGGTIRSVRHLQPNADQLEFVCRQCQHFVELEIPPGDLQRVLWCASPEAADARELLAEQLGVAVEPVEAVENLVLTGGSQLSSEQLATFGPAIGLALTGLHDPKEIIRLAGYQEAKEAPRYEGLQRILTYPGRCAAAAVGLLILATLIHVGALSNEIGKMRKLLSELDQSGSVMASLEPKMRAMQRLEKYRIDVEGIVADLCKPIPDSIVITSIRLSRERELTLKGTAKDPKTIFALVNALRKSSRFGTVSPQRTKPGKNNEFTISAELLGIEKFSSFVGKGRRWR